MTTPNEQQDELLSGYLDGELSRDEAAHLEFLLQRDPTLVDRLAKLRQIRGFVKRSAIVSSRTSSDFANRVIEAARQRGRELALPPTHPIFLGERSSAAAARSSNSDQSNNIAAIASATPASDFASNKERSGSHRKLLAAAMALAAAILAVVGLIRLSNMPSGSPEFAAQPSETGAELVVDKVTTSKDLNSQDLPASDPAMPVDPLAAPQPNSENIDTLAADRTTKLPSENNVTDFPELPSEIASADSIVSNNTSSMKSDNAPANTQSSRSQLVMIFDFVQSQDAWERNALLQILSAHDIAYERPLVADEDITKALAESRFIGQDIATANQPTEKVSLIYVRSRADRLDAAVREITGNAQDFPSVHLDMASNAPGEEIGKLLEAVQEFDEQDASMARPVIPSGNLNRFDRWAMVAQFPGGPRRGMELQGAFRDQAWVSPGNAAEPMPVVTMIFIVRDQVE